jgi:hypothetical protein
MFRSRERQSHPKIDYAGLGQVLSQLESGNCTIGSTGVDQTLQTRNSEKNHKNVVVESREVKQTSKDTPDATHRIPYSSQNGVMATIEPASAPASIEQPAAARATHTALIAHTAHAGEPLPNAHSTSTPSTVNNGPTTSHLLELPGTPVLEPANLPKKRRVRNIFSVLGSSRS